MPQLNFADFSPQIVWLAITFVVLYLAMARVALPGITKVLDDRERRIQDDLDRAEQLKSEADGVLQAYDKAIAEARAAAQSEIQKAAAEMAEAASAREAELGESLAAQIEAAERRIGEAKTAALADVRSVAAGVAGDAAVKLAGLTLTGDQAQAAVEAVSGGQS